MNLSQKSQRSATGSLNRYKGLRSLLSQGCPRKPARAARHPAGCSPAAIRVRFGCIRVSPCSWRAFATLEQAGRERRPRRVLETTLGSSLLQAYTRSTER
jgi:hypothetical protein